MFRNVKLHSTVPIAMQSKIPVGEHLLRSPFTLIPRPRLHDVLVDIPLLPRLVSSFGLQSQSDCFKYTTKIAWRNLLVYPK